MPFFKSTYNILVTPWEDEVFESKWHDSNKLILPPGGPDDKSSLWDYNREMTIEDVDIWEVIYEESGGKGVYASWKPWAEFYMITTGWIPNTYNSRIIEVYYGPEAQTDAYKRTKQLGWPIGLNSVWVENDELWLYEKPKELKKIIFS
jgi:hypothetical protein